MHMERGIASSIAGSSGERAEELILRGNFQAVLNMVGAQTSCFPGHTC